MKKSVLAAVLAGVVWLGGAVAWGEDRPVAGVLEVRGVGSAERMFGERGAALVEHGLPAPVRAWAEERNATARALFRVEEMKGGGMAVVAAWGVRGNIGAVSEALGSAGWGNESNPGPGMQAFAGDGARWVLADGGDWTWVAPGEELAEWAVEASAGLPGILPAEGVAVAQLRPAAWGSMATWYERWLEAAGARYGAAMRSLDEENARRLRWIGKGLAAMERHMGTITVGAVREGGDWLAHASWEPAAESPLRAVLASWKEVGKAGAALGTVGDMVAGGARGTYSLEALRPWIERLSERLGEESPTEEDYGQEAAGWAVYGPKEMFLEGVAQGEGSLWEDVKELQELPSVRAWLGEGEEMVCGGATGRWWKVSEEKSGEGWGVMEGESGWVMGAARRATLEAVWETAEKGEGAGVEESEWFRRAWPEPDAAAVGAGFFDFGKLEGVMPKSHQVWAAWNSLRGERKGDSLLDAATGYAYRLGEGILVARGRIPEDRLVQVGRLVGMTAAGVRQAIDAAAEAQERALRINEELAKGRQAEASRKGKGHKGTAKKVRARKWKGWKEAYVLENGRIRAVVVPGTGRLAWLSKRGGPNLLRLADGMEGALPPEEGGGDFFNVGGCWMWPVEQSRWPELGEGAGEWPPPAVLADAGWEASVVGRSVVLKREYGAPVNVAVKRTLRVPAGGSCVVETLEAVRTADSTVPVALWSVAQMARPEEIRLPGAPETWRVMAGAAGEGALGKERGATVYRPEEGGELKLGGNPEDGVPWVEGWRGNTGLKMTLVGGRAKEAGDAIEMYSNTGLGYAELETLGGDVGLEAGSAAVAMVTYEVIAREE